MSLYDFEAQSIDHQTVPLSRYKGQVMLIVNTASACGFTPQFTGLEKLHKTGHKA
jgi:glutathione peroxidase